MLREPVGGVARIVPRTFPLVIATWKMAPALAAGAVNVLPAGDTRRVPMPRDIPPIVAGVLRQ